MARLDKYDGTNCLLQMKRNKKLQYELHTLSWNNLAGEGTYMYTDFFGNATMLQPQCLLEDICKKYRIRYMSAPHMLFSM